MTRRTKHLSLKNVTFIAAALFFQVTFGAGAVKAGGSLGYDDVKLALPDETLLFETLENALDFSPNAFAQVRIMSGLNEEMAGRRVGPYYVCAAQKFWDRRKVRVTFNTEAGFIGPRGEVTGFPETDTIDLKETLIGVTIRPVDSPGYFPTDCLTEK